MYKLEIKTSLDKIFSKLVKRNKKQYDTILKKVEEIIENPNHYKNLKKPLQHLKRVHIDKHFVLTFEVDENKKLIILDSYEHHNNIYKKSK